TKEIRPARGRKPLLRGTGGRSRRYGNKPSISKAWRNLIDTRQKEKTMNWNQVEGNWEQFKGKVQSQWGKLTGDDLAVIDGKRKELTGKIQERYGKAQEEAEREVDDWL